jgi:hypothetical protein
MTAITSAVFPFIPSLPGKSPEEPAPEKTPNFVKRWCLGVETGLFIQLPFTAFIGILAAKIGLTPEKCTHSITSLKPTPSLTSEAWKLDPNFEKLSMAHPEFWKKELEKIDLLHIRERERAKLVSITVAIALPAIEEILFRGLIQDVLLNRIPKKILKRLAPQKTWILDSRVTQIARIVLVSALFAALHLMNKGISNHRLVLHFTQGLAWGTIKESKLGLTGAIAAHMTNNAVATLVGRLL